MLGVLFFSVFLYTFNASAQFFPTGFAVIENPGLSYEGCGFDDPVLGNNQTNAEIYFETNQVIVGGEDIISLGFDFDGFSTELIAINDIDLLVDAQQMNLGEIDLDGADDPGFDFDVAIDEACVGNNFAVAIFAGAIQGDGDSIIFVPCGAEVIEAGSNVRLIVGDKAVHQGGGENKLQVLGECDAGGRKQRVISIAINDFDKEENEFVGFYYIPSVAGFGSANTLAFSTPAQLQPGGGGRAQPAPPDSDPDQQVIVINLENQLSDLVFESGEQLLLTWNTDGSQGGGVDFVNLRYSINGGSTFSPIALNIANSGSYNWTLPKVFSDEVVVRIEATDLAIILDTDLSDEFVIYDKEEINLEVLSPIGGEFLVGQDLVFKWGGKGIDRISKVEILREEIGNWEVVAEDIESNEFRWVVEANKEEDIYWRVIGYDVLDRLIFDVVDEPFRVLVALGRIDPVRPMTNDVFINNQIEEIVWETENIEGDIDIYWALVGDGELSWNLLSTNVPNTGSWNWSLQGFETGDYILKFEASSVIGEEIVRVSDEFRIVQAGENTFNLLNPNGGEILFVGDNVQIDFDVDNDIEFIDIFISRNNGQSYSLLVADWSTQQNYLWNVTGPATQQARIRIESVVNGVTFRDSSNQSFSIVVRDDEVIDDDEIIEDPGEEIIDSQEDGGVEETAQGGEEDSTMEIVANVFVGNSTLVPVRDGAGFVFLNGARVRIVVEDRNGVASRGEVLLNGNLNNIELIEGRGEISFIARENQEVVIRLIDEESERLAIATVPISVRGNGLVQGEDGALGNALVSVWSGGNLVNVSNFGFVNPVRTGEDGLIGWMLPNGNYRLTVAVEGYESREVNVQVSNGILNPVITMNLVPVAVAEERSEGVLAPITTTARDVSRAVVRSVQNLRENPTANVVADISEPVVVATAITGAVLLASSFNLLPLLQYIFTFPLLFFARRRRNAYGTVYNAISKVPIPLATIRIKDENGKVVRSMVTSPAGKFVMRLNPGRYKVEVLKVGFNFPSEYLKDEKADSAFLDVYTGGEIEVSEIDAVVGVNIPVDPAEKTGNEVKILKKQRFLRVFQIISAHIGLILSLFVLLVQPSWLTGILAGVQIFVYLMSHLLLHKKAHKGWGIVRDKESNEPLQNAVIRLFEPRFNKLIETQITDSKGRYTIVAGANEYYLKAMKEGYKEQEVRPIDLKDRKEPEPISTNVSLEKV